MSTALTASTSLSKTKRWIVLVPTALLSVFGVIALIALFVVGARLDRDAERDASEHMNEALDRSGDALGAMAKDNAWWDEAFEHVSVHLDMAWVESTWGAGGFSTDDGEADGLFAVDRQGRLIGGYARDDIKIDQAFIDSMKDLKDLVAAAASDPSPEPHAVIRALRTSQGVVLAAAVPITPYTPEDG